MNKLKLALFFFFSGLFFFIPAKSALAGNFAGVDIVIENSAGTNLNNIAVGFRADTNAFYSGGGLNRSCDSDNTGTGDYGKGPFVNLNGTNVYYADLDWAFKTGGVYEFPDTAADTYKYDNPSGHVYLGNGAGSGMGFGFACSCNPLKIMITVPSGMYYDANGDNNVDSGETGKVTISVGGFSNDATTQKIYRLKDITLTVSLTANPTSGVAPLNNVDATVTLGGSATGNARFRFNCNSGDSTYESDTTSNVNTKTVADLCDYASPGTYSLGVRVNRMTEEVTDVVTITVSSPPPNYTLSLNIVGQGNVTSSDNQASIWNSFKAYATHALRLPSPCNGPTSSPCVGTYTSGRTATLTANPAVGWNFAGWSGSVSGTTNPIGVPMDGNKAVTATFVTLGCSITSPSPNQGNVPLTTRLTAIPTGSTGSYSGIEYNFSPDNGATWLGWGSGTKDYTFSTPGTKQVKAQIRAATPAFGPQDCGNNPVTVNVVPQSSGNQNEVSP